MAYEFNIYHPSKRVPYGGNTEEGDLVVEGEDLTGSTFKMSIAATRGATPLINLNMASAGMEGISVTYDSAYVSEETRGVVGASTIRPQIDEATLEALTWGGDPAADLVLYYDLLETPASGLQRVVRYGTFTIGAGVTD